VGKTAEAETALRRAVAIRPTTAALNVLGTRAAQEGEPTRAISYFEQSIALEPMQPDILYQLTLAYGVRRNLVAARATALRLARIAPGYPGLPELLRVLDLQR
jgi:Flp pilus assembly protein TadD